MINLIRQGYYNEMPHGVDTDPSIKKSLKKTKIKNMDKIVSYLLNGVELITCAGMVEDVIEPSRGCAGIPSVLTDGTWHWPGDLAYYVKNYNLELPSEFIDTMERNDWKIPITIEDIDFNELLIDGEFLFRE